MTLHSWYRLGQVTVIVLTVVLMLSLHFDPDQNAAWSTPLLAVWIICVLCSAVIGYARERQKKHHDQERRFHDDSRIDQ